MLLDDGFKDFIGEHICSYLEFNGTPNVGGGSKASVVPQVI